MVLIYDNFLNDFDDYYNRVKFARYSDVQSQEIKYSDISTNISADKLYELIGKYSGITPINVLHFLRAYIDRPSYRHPMWIHSDVLFSDYIGIFFVQPSEFPQDDGVALWKNKELNDIQIYTKNHIEEKNKIIDTQTLDPEKWELWKRIEFKQNRLVLFPASYFHSTATYGHSGKSIDKCRIVHVLFFNKG